MAKKFVRGVTGVEDINRFDKTLTNVNDIVSDGQDTYVHTKKGKTESYYKLTDSLKTVSSDNTDLLTVTKDDTTNSATLHPKHDNQKEQAIESTRDTVIIQHAENGTSATTKVDTNPAKVLEHNNLLTGYGINKTTSEGKTTLGVEYTRIGTILDLNTLMSGRVKSNIFYNSPRSNIWYLVTSETEGRYTIQTAKELTSENNTTYVRVRVENTWSQWREQVGDKSVIDNLLNQKQNTLTNNGSIGIIGNTLRQLYGLRQTYNVNGGTLKTHVKSISENTNVNTPEEEFNFIVKLNKSVSSVNFTLNTHDATKFSNIMSAYGDNNSVRISGCVFTLLGSTLTVSTANNTDQNYVITFSDII